jgi:choline dehydrogenase-like flavoprotein
VPEGSTLDDWPITYDDLEPFYDRAEWELGVAGDLSGDPFKGPRRRPLPMPPLPDDLETQLMKPAAQRLGWHPFSFPALRNTVAYNGRPPCMRCRWCVGFACECEARTGSHNTVIPWALATGNCELRTHCMVREIQLDARGRGRAVEYFDARNRRRVQTADVIVVAGGAIESARLLLNSRSRLFPKGLGNRHDWVGRNLQGHVYSGGCGLFEQVTYNDLGPGGQIAICDFNHGVPGLIGGGMLATEFIRLPIHFLGWRPPDVPRWGQGLKDFLRTYHRRSIVIIGPLQEIPTFHARVEADPKVRDFWGIPVARLSGTDHPHNLEISRFMADKAEQWLLEAGATRVLRRQKNAVWLSAGQHQSGTCRMGNDPATSVVNRDGRLHDVPNVFVADASLHVTNGGFNPVLTIMALGYHVADSIQRAWKGGGLR